MKNLLARKRIAGWALLLLTAVVLFVVADNVVWTNDDIRYQYKFTPELHTLDHDYDEYNDGIETIGDVVSSQAVHYVYWGGRSLVHAMATIFLTFIGHTGFAVVNAIIFVIFVSLILRRVGYEVTWKEVAICISLAILCMSTRMTPEYQINYIWVFTLQLIFISEFLGRKATGYSLWHLPLLFLLGLVSGFSQEVVAVGIGGAVVIYFITNAKTFGTCRYALAIGYGIGLAALVLAPGNFVRVAESDAVTLAQGFRTLIGSAKALYVLAIVTLWLRFKTVKTLKEIYVENSFYWNALAVCLLFNLIVGFSGTRQILGAELMAIVLVMRMLPGGSFNRWFCVVAIVVTALFLYKQFSTTLEIRREYERIETQYATSETGEVYSADIRARDDGRWANYYIVIPTVGSGDRSVESFAKSLHRRYAPSKPYVKIVPECLRGKDSVDMGNQIIPLGHDITLIVKSVSNPARFDVERYIDLPGLHRSYAPIEVALGEPVKETALWQAYLVNEADYTIYGISKNRIVKSE